MVTDIADMGSSEGPVSGGGGDATGGYGSLVGGIASGAGAIGGSIIQGQASAQAQQMANEENDKIFEESKQFNYDQAIANRNFQEMMSNSAHTREVADLKNAGLNPILSAHGGASSPGGSTASAPSAPTMQPVNPWSGLGSAVSTALGTAKDVMTFTKQMQSQDADIAMKKAGTLASVAAANNNQASARATQANMPNIEAKAKSANAEADAAISKAAADQAKASWDTKMSTFDAINSRLQSVIQGVSSAVGAARGAQNIGIDSQANTRANESHIRDQGIHGTELP